MESNFYIFKFIRNYDNGYDHKKSYKEKRKKGKYGYKRPHKYYNNDPLSNTFSGNKNYEKKYSGDFINKNSNYAKKPEIAFKNNNNFNGNKNYQKNKKEEEDIKKPIFINSKLENNGNPDGNFLKLDQDIPKYNFVPNGEINPNNNNNLTNNDFVNNRNNKKENDTLQFTNDLSKSMNLDRNFIIDNNKSYNYSQKYYYNKHKYYDNKSYNHNKNLKGNNYPLNQPSSRRNNNNKFDGFNRSGRNNNYDGGTKYQK